MNDFMVDIESLGTQPESCIFAIGGVFFDRYSGDTGRGFYTLINPDCNHNAKRHRSAQTLEFWARQEVDAKAELERSYTEGVTLYDALYRLGQTITIPDLQIWANGDSFDISALQHAYRQVGLPIPWSYNAMRDMRTIKEFKLAVADEIPDEPVAHHAMHDAHWQARFTSLVFRRFATLTSGTHLIT